MIKDYMGVLLYVFAIVAFMIAALKDFIVNLG